MRFLQLRAWIMYSFIMLISLLVISECWKEQPYVELLTHWKVFFSLIYIGYGLFFIRYRCRWGIFTALLACCWSAYPWIHLGYWEKPIHDGSRSRVALSILQWNVFYKNQQVTQWITTVNQQKLPDILLIEEVTPRILNQLTPLIEKYAYHFFAPQMDSYGMVILSKLPLMGSKRVVFHCSTNHYSLMELSLSPEHTPILLVECHIRSSSWKQDIEQRRAELQELAAVIARQPHRYKIVLGDMNTTPYSPYLQQFLAQTDLKNTMQGARFQGTWPSYFPGWLRLPIDHLFISDSIELQQQQFHFASGSDHLSVWSQLNLIF